MRAESETAVGFPLGGIVAKPAPVTFGASGPSEIAAAIAAASRVGLTAAPALAGTTSSTTSIANDSPILNLTPKVPSKRSIFVMASRIAS